MIHFWHLNRINNDFTAVILDEPRSERTKQHCAPPVTLPWFAQVPTTLAMLEVESGKSDDVVVVGETSSRNGGSGAGALRAARQMGVVGRQGHGTESYETLEISSEDEDGGKEQALARRGDSNAGRLIDILRRLDEICHSDTEQRRAKKPSGGKQRKPGLHSDHVRIICVFFGRILSLISAHTSFKPLFAGVAACDIPPRLSSPGRQEVASPKVSGTEEAMDLCLRP
jgi:hypothetical protein